MFEYTFLMTFEWNGVTGELIKEGYESPCQFQAGDMLNIFGIDEIKIERVSWYAENPGRAFVELESCSFGFDPSEIEWFKNPGEQPPIETTHVGSKERTFMYDRGLSDSDISGVK